MADKDITDPAGTDTPAELSDAQVEQAAGGLAAIKTGTGRRTPPHSTDPCDGGE